MLNKCPVHKVVIEYSVMHGAFICPISVCSYHEDEYGNGSFRADTRVNWSPRFNPVNTVEDDIPKGLIIPGEVIYEKISEEEYDRAAEVRNNNE